MVLGAGVRTPNFARHPIASGNFSLSKLMPFTASSFSEDCGSASIVIDFFHAF